MFRQKLFAMTITVILPKKTDNIGLVSLSPRPWLNDKAVFYDTFVSVLWQQNLLHLKYARKW